MSSPTGEALESIASGKTDADDLKLVSVFKPSADTAEFAERIYDDVFGNV
jgi:NitT/TauT family transport system substrate-binding protein